MKPDSFKDFLNVDPQPVDLLEDGDLVRSSPLLGGDGPLCVEPTLDDLDPTGWAEEHRGQVDDWLTEHGAVLFRGFRFASVSRFEAFAEALCDGLFSEYGDLPNEEEGEKVYHSTPYPADKAIEFHNESSHMHRWPRKQWFYCVRPAPVRGETPVVDCRRAYAELEADLRDELERRGLLYVRNFVSGLDVGWRDFFRTGDRQAVEAFCRQAGIRWRWLEDDGLRTEQWAPAVVKHPVTGDKVLFHQIQLHHVSFLDDDVRASLLSLFGEDGLPRNVYFGDGEPIPDAAAQRVGDLYHRLAVEFPWHRDDVLMVDNMRIAHGRKPFEGERKIVVAMGNLVTQGEVVEGS